MNTVSTHVYFPADLYGQLTALALQRDEPIASVVRDLVAVGVKKKIKATKKVYKNPLDWLLAMSVKAPKGTPKDISINHNKYLYD